MRHGKAETAAASDFARRLTHVGIEAVAKSVAGLSAKHIEPTRIFASPLVRAQETAAIVAKHMAIDEPIHTLEEISPSGSPEQVARALKDAIVANDLCLMVTHQPFVSLFIRFLTGREMYIGTADIACISMDTFNCKNGQLEWLIHV